MRPLKVRETTSHLFLVLSRVSIRMCGVLTAARWTARETNGTTQGCIRRVWISWTASDAEHPKQVDRGIPSQHRQASLAENINCARLYYY